MAAALAAKDGVSCEIIDLRTILPWDEATVMESVKKTGRCIISHEAPQTCGYGAEVAAKIQEKCFTSLQAPVRRVCGYDTPFPMAFETFYLPDRFKIYDAIKQTLKY